MVNKGQIGNGVAKVLILNEGPAGVIIPARDSVGKHLFVVIKRFRSYSVPGMTQARISSTDAPESIFSAYGESSILAVKPPMDLRP